VVNVHSSIFFFFETVSFYVAHASLEFVTLPRLSRNSLSFCLCFPTGRVTDVSPSL
jgi:hypothetical protein